MFFNFLHPFLYSICCCFVIYTHFFMPSIIRNASFRPLRGSASPSVRATRLTAVPSSPVRKSVTLASPWTVTWLGTLKSHQATLANKLLGFVRRNCRFIHSTSVRHTLYLGLVHAHLGYATQVWALQGIELISKLKSIQRRATYLLQRKTNVSKPSSCVLLARVARSSILLLGYA